MTSQINENNDENSIDLKSLSDILRNIDNEVEEENV